MKNTNTSAKDTHKTQTAGSKKNNSKASNRGLGRNSKDSGHFSGYRSVTVIVDQDVACEILSRSYGIDPTSPDAVRDVYNIYVGVNLWCGIFCDVLDKQAELLVNRIRLFGLDVAIGEADSHCLYLTSEGAYGTYSAFWAQFYDLERACTRNGTINWRVASVDRFTEEYRNMLTLLKFLKRLRIEEQDYTFMYKEYKDLNNACRDWNKYDYSYYDEYDAYDKRTGQVFIPRTPLSYEDWSKKYRTASDRLLDDISEAIFFIFRDYRRQDSLFTLPPGVTYEGAKSYLDKFKIVLRNQAWLREHGVNIPVVPVNNLVEPSDCNRYITVPKNYKTGRGVAPEPVSRQVLGYQVDYGMRRCLRKNHVDLNDQSWNQHLCAVSRDGGKNLVTIDKSSASDSISLSLVKRVYSWVPSLLSDLLQCRTNFINVDDDVVRNYRFATMGNAITCALQSGIYLAIAKVAYDYCYIFRDRRRKWRYDFWDDVAVYNDDVIIPNEIAPTYMQIAESLGFTINYEKTYTNDQKYRESCGVEYVYHRKRSCEVTGAYYPRGTSRNALPELVGLQHKLHMYPSANAVISNLILDVFPEMTVSCVGSQYSDIWSSEPFERIAGSSKYGDFVYDVILHYRDKVGSALCLKKDTADVIRSTKLCTVSTSLNKEEQISYISDVYSRWSSTHPNEWVSVSFSNTRLTSLADPLGAYGTIHTTITSKTAKVKLSSSDSALVELLMYLLSIGKGIEHINTNEFASESDHIMNRYDLVANRREQVQNLYYLF